MSGACAVPPWSGTWVSSALGVRLVGAAGARDAVGAAGARDAVGAAGARDAVGAAGARDAVGAAGSPARLEELVGLAVRRNPRRAHLLVSTVLGKHVPTDPHRIRAAALELGALVAGVLTEGAAAGGRRPAPPVVLGFAETATALGQTVAEALDAAGLGGTCLHSTRRRVATAPPLAVFEEEHSHATSHLVCPADPAVLDTAAPLVLVDDELSTGATALNTIAAVHAARARDRYVIAALVDLRTPADVRRCEETARTLGTRIDVVALATGTVSLPGDVLARGREVVRAASAAAPGAAAAPSPGAADPGERVERGEPVVRVDVGWPADLPEGARHGTTPEHRRRLQGLLPAMAAVLDAAVGEQPGDVLVLGTEELLHAPQRLAAALAERLAGRGDPRSVRSSSTTRSPVLAVDDPGCAIRTALAFPAHDDAREVQDQPDGASGGGGQRYAYNVAPARGVEPFGTVVVVVDDAGDTPALHAGDGLLAAVGAVCGRVLLVVLPSWRPLPPPLTGPAFGSYAAAEVSWLLTDLSGAALEAPTEEREEAVQQGRAHYAESLPVEYQPDAAYTALFTRALAASAARLARAVGTVTEQVLAARGQGLVLASLARAGTPIGILVRRWAAQMHGLDVPHCAVSIVRGRGLDPVALRHLAAAHDPASVVFLDGWTGKGAITRELAEAVEAANRALGLAPGRGFDPELAVLADPGSCTPVFGTREDFLIPSACLNSTVSGLVSRTVLGRDVLAPGQFHGAKFYAELAGADVSNTFLDAVSDRFAGVADLVRADVAALPTTDRTPTWAGWAAVEAIADHYGIGSVNLVKPGVGETTRVLLRRVPWRVLVRRGAGADLDHVRLLAEQRGVPVEEVDPTDLPGLAGLPYACVGLIHPDFTRGATGDDGTAVRPARGPGTV